MAETQTMTGRAIVAHDTLANKGWKMENVTTRPIKDDELLVEVIASGICHTDVLLGSVPTTPPMFFYPRVLGHEGSGYVKAVGSKVTTAKPGDAVLLSFDHCATCVSCKSGLPSLCYKFNELNFCNNPGFTLSDAQGASADSPDIGCRFFGQSSFANYTVVSETSVVNANDLVKSKEELQLFAPLGCGIQTGSGTVINVAKATPNDVVAVQGLGGVGLSAIMAAKVQGCRIIIGVDRVEKRLNMAKEFGATHVVDTSKIPEGKTVTEVVQEIADGVGPNYTIETTGVPFLIKGAVELTRMGGTVIQVGSAPADFKLELPVFDFMCSGKSYRGAIEGNASPKDFLPKMIQWYREGRFPFDKLIKMMPAEEFETALLEMRSGETVKPVITWT